jgi:hypothetical protein
MGHTRAAVAHLQHQQHIAQQREWDFIMDMGVCVVRETWVAL